MAYKRKTRDEYQVWQNTGYGWEEICASEDRKEALADLKAYRENQPEFPVKLKKARIKIEQTGA